MTATLAEAPVETEAEAPPPEIAAIDTPAVTAEQLRAYRRKVYAAASKVIADHSWCSESNEYLNRMGLPNRGTVRVPVDVVTSHTLWVEVAAMDGEDALIAASADEDATRAGVDASVRSIYGTGTAVQSWTIASQAISGGLEPEKPTIGDWDFTGGGMASGGSVCSQTNPHHSGYCTRRPGHTGHHAVGSSASKTITGVWTNRKAGQA